MKWGVTLVACLAFAVGLSAQPLRFDNAAVGILPSDWMAGATGGGAPLWTVEADASAPSKPNVLKQSGQSTFSWCVKKDVSIEDGFAQVRFKTVSGKEDQAGGLVWRWKDGNDYYVVRANALEDNVTLYHMIGGKRRAFKNASAPVATNRWHTLRVNFKKDRITVSFDGNRVIDTRDRSIAGPGSVGVWTKSDSVTLFDDFDFGSR